MTSTRPLSGLTVLEIGHSFAAPFAGFVLAQLGARVIKLESPHGGDSARGWGPPFLPDGSTPAFQAFNRDKLGIAADLKRPEDVDRLRRLIVEEVDIVLHNLRFGSLERHGLGAKALLAAKPSLVYCNIGAFGNTGPLADRPGYDPLMQAFAGVMSVTGEEGRQPIRAGASIVDIGTGIWAALGITAAIVERTRTGVGGVVDTSLLETALGWMSAHVANFTGAGVIGAKQMSGLAEIVPYQAFEANDGYFMVAAGNDNLFRKLASAIGRADLAADPRFSSNGERVRHREVIVGELSSVFAQRTKSAWMELLADAGVPCGPIQSIDEVVAHPQVTALGIVQQSPGIPVRTLGLPISFGGERPACQTAAPRLGEHNDLIFGQPEPSSDSTAAVPG
jgi:crotonobetainyl-CoA:carnitine CoA-transferase CaiB-like acyl-CoA transferase